MEVNITLKKKINYIIIIIKRNKLSILRFMRIGEII